MSGMQTLLEQLVASKTGGHGFVPPRKAGRAYQNPALRQLLAGRGGLPAGQGPTDAQTQGHAAMLQKAAQQFASQQSAGSTGGMLAPDESPDAGGSQAGDPLANLVAGFQKWSQQHGGQVDPLGQLAQGHRTASGFLEGFGGRAVQQAPDPRVNQTGNARNGLAFQTYELGGGRMVHVYFDPKTGKRTPIYFNRPG